jgi:uncharacterized membrane protein
MPMSACYGDEQSSMRILSVIPEFLIKHAARFAKRFFYSYLLRDFSVATLGLLLGLPLLLFGFTFGSIEWYRSISNGVQVSSGTVMLAALPIVAGTQFLLTFLNYDINNVPNVPVSENLKS